MFIARHNLDHVCRIQRNIWLKTRQREPIINIETRIPVMYFSLFWNKVYGHYLYT